VKPSRRGLLKGTALSAAALALPRKAEARADAPSGPARRRSRLSSGWRFHLGHAQDPARDFDFGLNQRTYAKAGTAVATAAAAEFDDSGWQAVRLPHDWAVDLPFVNNPDPPPPGEDDPKAAHGFKPLGRDHPETSVGWYRLPLTIPADMAGQRLSLEFDGAFRDVVVLLNGFIVHEHEGGYSPFRVDITDVAAPGETNILTVRVDASLGEGWFYEGAGLYRHVWLVATHPIHVPQWGAWVRSEPQGTGATAQVTIDLRNESPSGAACEVAVRVLDPDGAPVAERSETTRLEGWTDGGIDARLSWDRAMLWSTDTPRLYRLIAEVRVDGRVVDRYEQPFGLRTARFDAERGFFLNERPLKLLGACCHQDHAGVGAALPDRLQVWRLEQLKAMGCNAYRASHNPPTPEWLDACDALGLLVINETRRMASDSAAMAELDSLVRRDRNRPSVIAWSIGNEEQAIQGTARGARIATTMVRRINRLDPTRPTTAALDQDFGEGVSRVVDILGFNYRTPQMEPYHARFPDQPILGSETGSTVQTRGEYVRDDARHIVPAYDTEHPWWASTAEDWWTIAAERPYIAGGFIWTGFDYRGEPTPFNRWPSVASYFGAMDSCGFPKDNYWYYRAWWRPEPLVHLFPHWNWEGREGQPVPVWVHANVDRVELFLNGRSLGAKDVERNRHLEWSVPYAPGVIEARGYKDGRALPPVRRETVGPAARIELTADRTRLDGDGQDVAMLAVRLLDQRGRAAPRAAEQITFSVEGPGRIIGVGNGDPTSHEPDRAATRKTFNGLAQAILQVEPAAGEISVTASGPGLRPATIRLRAS
jgi:beta-galactosidase